MTNPKIVRPTPVDIRTAWPREDRDLTPWLADNLDYLEVLGLGELEAVGVEVSIPRERRRLDILATTADDRRVAIENQYRSIDHDHLTRGLAYAVALEAAALVIIAEGHGDEFIEVADYLNRAAEALGDNGLAIFLVSLEVEQVGDFLVPRFDVVSRPNLWRAELVADSSVRESSEADTARRRDRQEFWTQVLNAAGRRDASLWAVASPAVGSTVTVTAVSGHNITWNMGVRVREAYPMLWIDTGDAVENTEILYALRDKIGPADFGFDVDWSNKEGARACAVVGSPVDECGWVMDSSDRADSIEELIDRTRKFVDVLEPVLGSVVNSVVSRR